MAAVVNCGSPCSMKSSSSLHQMLYSILEERRKESKERSLDDNGFVLVTRSLFWTQLFQENFIEHSYHADDMRDDLLFYVRKKCVKNKAPDPQIEVFRHNSENKPTLDDQTVDWEETVYLNIILQQFEYVLTCAVCSRTGEKELQILKKFSQKVYASPSKRSMEDKGTEEEITYPNIFFTIDNFEEVFSDIVVRDSEMVCVELVANDRDGRFQGVIFLGSIRYDALKTVYDTRASLSSKMRMSFGLSSQPSRRVEFVRMRGPGGKGHAEMAISRQQGTGPETPNQENFKVEDFENNGSDQQGFYSQRRMSDPSTALSAFMRGGFKKGIRKSQSEAENVDHVGGCDEVIANDIADAKIANKELKNEMGYQGFLGRSFGQAWHWFKERRRASSVALNSYLTYVTLPWHRIIGDVLEVRQQPLLSF